MADILTAEDFTPLIDKIFRAEGQPQSLTLVKLDRYPGAGLAGAREPFTLILRGSREDLLPEGQYRCTVEAGPSFELYIIPIYTPARGHQDYQVVFN